MYVCLDNFSAIAIIQRRENQAENIKMKFQAMSIWLLSINYKIIVTRTETTFLLLIAKVTNSLLNIRSYLLPLFCYRRWNLESQSIYQWESDRIHILLLLLLGRRCFSKVQIPSCVLSQLFKFCLELCFLEHNIWSSVDVLFKGNSNCYFIINS